MARLDYAPRQVLTHLRAGWTLRTVGIRAACLSPEANDIMPVNRRTLNLLLREHLIEIDQTWNHPIVTRYRLVQRA